MSEIIEYPKVNRVEVIDKSGRALIYPQGSVCDVFISIQDDETTLKVFLDDKNPN